MVKREVNRKASVHSFFVAGVFILFVWFIFILFVWFMFFLLLCGKKKSAYGRESTKRTECKRMLTLAKETANCLEKFSAA